MIIPTNIEEAPRFYAQHFTEQVTSVQVEPLTEANKEAALDFLSERPVHTVIMAGWIMEHGIESPLHRGTFYGCWNATGNLEGVALIGRATMFETRSDTALRAFAELAKRDSSIHLFFTEATELEKFWRYFKVDHQEPSLICHELFYVKEAEPLISTKAFNGLRKAVPEDLREVAAAHAQMIEEETGENPLEKDSAGFYERCAGRIKEGKVWLLKE